MRHPLFCRATLVVLFFLSAFCSPVKADFSEWNAFSFEVSPDKSPEDRLTEFLERFSGDDIGVSISNASDEKASWIQLREDGGIVAITPMEAGVYAIQLLIERPKNTVLETLGISFSSNTLTPYLISINGSELHLDTSGAPLDSYKFEKEEIPKGETEDDITKYFVTFYVLNQSGGELLLSANVETTDTTANEEENATNGIGSTETGSVGSFGPRLGNSPLIVTPEPVTCLFFGAGLLAVGWGLRWKKRAK